MKKQHLHAIIIPMQARDFEGIRLSPAQLRRLEYYLDRIDSGSFSYRFIKDLRESANSRFQRAFQHGNEVVQQEVGPELQVLNHILHTVYGAGSVPSYTELPDEFRFVLDVDEGRACSLLLDTAIWERILTGQEEDRVLARQSVEHYEEGCIPCQKTVEILEESLPSDQLGSRYSEVQQWISDRLRARAILEQAEEENEIIESQEEDEFSFLDPDTRADLEDDPEDSEEVAQLRERLRRLVLELREAEEDGEPAFIIRRIERNIAQVHEELSGFRSNPWGW